MVTDRPPHWPMLCEPSDKARLEAENAVEQVDYITSLVVGDYSVRHIRESHILQLQQLAVARIYPCGGTYRNARDETEISDSEHKVAHAADVRNLVTELVDWVNRERDSGRHEIECAAYALWRLNWIHPFRGGNGRTARMIAYMIICMGLGHMIPGIPTIPAMIYTQRDRYVEELRAIDADLRQQVAKGVDDPAPNFEGMVAFLQPMVESQVEAGVREGEAAP